MSNLHGIEKLLQLVVSDNEEVQRLAAGALRNVVFQNNNNKEEVMGNDGLACVLDALKSSRDVDTRRQLTGYVKLKYFKSIFHSYMIDAQLSFSGPIY